ncbi:ion transporter [Aestuariibacter sp. AA17]|uniref:Ion transporter n=1 Tax=Fluctibacter corallii TaxID=2984329 RepID=A0ABT3A8X0_9ALTE|nr:ion transporter [Aestuariibacter sp. AA17]MCV2885128.1 ion transporter [Aestuariibacter sp. AA17]
MLNFSLTKLKQSHEGPWLMLDLVMLLLLTINLLWIIFDTLFETQLFRGFLSSISQQVVVGYQPIHENFLVIDLVFIAIFLTEFFLRWLVAIYRKTYMRWYFFPFIHWYDLVGCIPLSATRIFRFLRIFSILHRLHKYQIIDLRRTALFRFIFFYYNVFVEELSDRIVVKVLSDAQEDIAAGSPLIDDIFESVLKKRQDIVCAWAAAMLSHIGDSLADANHGKVFRQHVRDSVGRAVRQNNQVNTLKLVPVVGSTIERTLEDVVTDIVTQSVVNLLQDLSPDKVDYFVRNTLTQFDPQEQALENEMLMVISEVLELIKSHVGEQRWKAELAKH